MSERKIIEILMGSTEWPLTRFHALADASEYVQWAYGTYHDTLFYITSNNNTKANGLSSLTVFVSHLWFINKVFIAQCIVYHSL